VSFVEAAEFEWAEVDIPDAVVDLFESVDAGKGDVAKLFNLHIWVTDETAVEGPREKAGLPAARRGEGDQWGWESRKHALNVAAHDPTPIQLLRGAENCLQRLEYLPPLEKGEGGGFSTCSNPPMLPFDKGGCKLFNALSNKCFHHGRGTVIRHS
jgi:hypothetical protein